jgi:hypothetical protein
MTLFKPPRLTIGIAPTNSGQCEPTNLGPARPGPRSTGGRGGTNLDQGAISEVSDRRDEDED